MAKIIVEFDTVSKTANASIDGKSVDNFKGVSVYGGYKRDFTIELVSGMEDEDNEIHYMTRVCADDGTLKKKDEDEEIKLDEQVQSEILSYFGIDDDE